MPASPPECGRCPAFLHDPESIRLGTCWGCRQPAAQMRVDAPPPEFEDDEELEAVPEEDEILELIVTELRYSFLMGMSCGVVATLGVGLLIEWARGL